MDRLLTMATADKLIKFLNSKNVAEFFDDKKLEEIASDVVTGYQVDDDSRQQWLSVNKAALKLINTTDNDDAEGNIKEFPFKGSAKVGYELIGPAVIQLAARLIQHLVRNNRVAECAVLGKDTPEIDPQTNQPTGLGVKEQIAKRVSDFISYELLIESDTWLPEQHKSMNILASWGMSFNKVTYDHVLEKPRIEVLSPEDVIINHNITSIELAKRITIRYYLSKNQLIEQIRAERFLDVDLDQMSSSIVDNDQMENDTRDKCPTFEVLCQTCYIDLDDDGYAEPYEVYVHNQSKTLLGIYPAYSLKHIKIDDKGKVLAIEKNCNIVAYGLIDDPSGKFYCLGLNHVLFNSAKSITSILRQLIDAGTLKNAASVTGLVTRAIKTKERRLQIKLGEFLPVDCDPSLRIQDQFMNLPMQEPSQVLLELLSLLIDNAKQTGMITDILTGEAETQNVPATTTLAMVEQGTRAFKPMIQKLYSGQKKTLKLWYNFHAEHMDKTKYFKFQGINQQICANDFKEDSLDICPVADPTQSSEAHKFAKAQFILQLTQTNAWGQMNPQVSLNTMLADMEYDNAQQMVAPPPKPQPNPELLQMQINAELKQKDQQLAQVKQQADHEIDMLKQQIAAQKVQIDADKNNIRRQEIAVQAHEVSSRSSVSDAEAHSKISHAVVEHQLANISKFDAETRRQKVNNDRNSSNRKD